MKILINISEETYNLCKDKELISNKEYKTELWEAVANGTPLPKAKTGHWRVKDGREIGYDIGGVKTWYIQIVCDKCGFLKTAIEGHTGQYNYCPNCGAKMEIEDADSN